MPSKIVLRKKRPFGRFCSRCDNKFIRDGKFQKLCNKCLSKTNHGRLKRLK